MQELEKLKSVLLDLNKNQQKFSAQFSEFEALQAQVSALEKRAPLDPEAGRKVRNVRAFMANEGQHAQGQIMTHVGAFERHLLKAREQLGALTVVEPKPLMDTAVTSGAPPRQKQNRNFA